MLYNRTKKHKRNSVFFNLKSTKHLFCKKINFQKLISKKPAPPKKLKSQCSDTCNGKEHVPWIWYINTPLYSLSIFRRYLKIVLPFVCLISFVITKLCVCNSGAFAINNFQSLIFSHFSFYIIFYGIVVMYFLLFDLGTFIPYILQADCYILITNAVTVILIPSLVILKLIAFSLEPFYKCILNVKPSYNNFVYNCIFQLRSRPLMVCFMLLCFSLFHSVFLISSIDPRGELYFAFYLQLDLLSSTIVVTMHFFPDHSKLTVSIPNVKLCLKERYLMSPVLHLVI
jgi:hypothetical protein